MAIIKNETRLERKFYRTKRKTVKSIRFDREYYKKEMDGVIKLLNEAWTLEVIATDLISKLTHERDGVKAISELEPNTELCITNILETNTDWLISEELYDLDEPVIIITEKQIKQAKYMVKQYDNLINLIDSYITGCYSVNSVDKDILGVKD